MGFYFELKKTGSDNLEFREQGVPQVFWTLYGLAGFALTCMGLAAHSLLVTLLNTGDPWDLILIGSIFFSVPVYLLIGVKLLWVRKFVQLEPNQLALGYFVGSRRFTLKRLPKSEIKEVLLINQRPSSNVAPARHGDSQYYIRGHWRLLVNTKSGKHLVLDRHTEKGALHSLQSSLRTWLE
jgi:hypothetical protein